MDFRKIVLSVLMVLLPNPILLYQFIVFLRFPTWISGSMLVLGLITSQLVLQIILMIGNTITRWLLMVGYLRKLDGCSYTTFSIRKYFENDNATYEDIDKWFVKSWSRMIGLPNVSLDQMVHIHVASGPRRSSNLAAYPLALFESHLFVHEGPKTATGIQRFFLLHEIGHAQMKVATSDFGNVPIYFFICWVAATASWNQSTLIVGAGFILAMILWKRGKRPGLNSVALTDEVLADSFALGYLSKEDLAKLATNKYLYSHLHDRELTPQDNSIRLLKLKQNLDLMIAGDGEQVLGNVFDLVPGPSGTGIAAALVLFALVGTCAAAPSLRTLFLVLILDGVLVVGFLFTFLLAIGTESAIKSKIAEEPAPA